MKKKVYIIFVLFLSLLLVSGTVLASDIVLKISNVGPAVEDDKTVIANKAFENYVEMYSGGRIEVKRFPGGQLGSARESLEGIALGTIEMGALTASPLVNFCKETMVLDIPYLFKSAPIAMEVMDGPFGQELAEKVRKDAGIRILAWADLGFRHFTNSKRPIRKPEDMQNLKFRVMENPVYIKLVKASGAYPTPIAFTELYLALQQGVVDGQENPLSLINSMKFYEVQKYLVMDGHSYNFAVLYINDDLFSSLSKEDQWTIKQGAGIWKYVHAGYSMVEINQSLGELQDKGMEITFLNSKEKEAFKEKLRGPVVEYVASQIGQEWIDKAFKAVESVETKYK